jgi:hypothetical protein
MCNRMLHYRWTAGSIPIPHDGRYFRRLSAMGDTSRDTGERAKGGRASMEFRYWNNVPLPWPGRIVHTKPYRGFKHHRWIARAAVRVKIPCGIDCSQICGTNLAAAVLAALNQSGLPGVPAAFQEVIDSGFVRESMQTGTCPLRTNDSRTPLRVLANRPGLPHRECPPQASPL